MSAIGEVLPDCQGVTNSRNGIPKQSSISDGHRVVITVLRFPKSFGWVQIVGLARGELSPPIALIALGETLIAVRLR
jgi:hypothetical protein